MSELCIYCGKRVTPRQQGLQCEPCGSWIHIIWELAFLKMHLARLFAKKRILIGIAHLVSRISSLTNSDYQLVLHEIENILPTYPSVTRMVLDFELAMWASIPIVFPEVCLMGCAFHWNQAVWRKIQDLGLVIAYR